jgi:hypothetical protein
VPFFPAMRGLGIGFAPLASATSPLALIACGVVLLYFINALRASIPYERLVEEQVRKQSPGTL